MESGIDSTTGAESGCDQDTNRKRNARLIGGTIAIAKHGGSSAEILAGHAVPLLLGAR